MNILFVVPYVPSLIRVRPYNLVKQLAKRGHCITLLSPWTDEQERDELFELGGVCHDIKSIHLPRFLSLWNAAKAIPSRHPLQSVYSWHPQLARQGLALWDPRYGPSPFDVVHVEHLRGAHYGLFLKNGWARLDSGQVPPVVWDSVDSISHLFRQASSLSKSALKRLVTRFELGRTERYEGWLVEQFEQVLVTSKADRQALLSLLPSQVTAEPQISVLPNGVDLDYFSCNGLAPRESETLVISGKMSYHANVTMALYLFHEIMPLVWKQRPGVKLVVAGKDPPREIMALASHPSLVVTGTVKDIRPFLGTASVSVVPVTYGAGIQNKVLEAMACSTPVVSSPQAVAALKAVPGQDLLVAGDPASFAEQVLFLLADPDRSRQVGQNGRRYVEQHHHWGAIAEKLENLYESTIESSR